jgi:hypothetical protein
VRKLFVLLAVLACALLAAPRADAHPMRSAFVEIDEVEPGHASVHVRTSVPDPAIELALAGCSLVSEDDRASTLDRGAAATCDDGTLAGHEVTLRGLGPVLSEGVVWVRTADGATFSHLLSRDAPAWTLPARASALGVARQYVRLGVEHILTGYDHLLFLLLLVLTLRRVRAVLLAETAFTLSHSLSFTATALGWVRVSPIAAEACIALSLVLVAMDVERRGRRRGLRSRWAVAGLPFVFGLVHGLGFAGGLHEIGLPDRDVAAALVSFGGGVEIGQVAFLAVVLLAVHYARRMRSWSRVALAGGYAGGAVASWWLVERVVALWVS